MAVSLAACGGEDDTPFNQADIDAATAPLNASIASLQGQITAIDQQIAAAGHNGGASVGADLTALVAQRDALTTSLTNMTALRDGLQTSLTATQTQLNALIAELGAAGFTDLTDLINAYVALVSPVTFALTDDDATGVSPDAPNLSQGNDTITGTDVTYDAADVIVDASTTDNDVMTIASATDLTATPTVINIETVNLNASGTFSSGDTTFSINLAGFSGTNTFNFGATASGSLVAGLTLTNADTASYVASSAFTTFNIAADTDADIELTVAADANITTTGAADDLTIHGGGFDVTVAASAATEDLVVDGAVDTAITAASIVGNVSVTGTGDSSVTTAAAEGNVTIASRGTIAVSATSAEGTVTLDNTGATAGDDITVTNLASATEVNITSVGAVSTGGTNMAAAATISVTAAEDSTIDADGVVADQTITLNGAEPDGDEITFTLNANSVDELVIGGSTAVEVLIANADLGSGDTAATVTSTNSANAAIRINSAAAADVRNVASDVDIRIGATVAANTVTIAANQTFFLDAEENYAAAVTLDHVTNATSATSTSTTLSLNDSVETNGDTTVLADGVSVTDVQALNIAIGTIDLTLSADITGADLESVIVTGSGDLSLGTNTITGDATNRVVLNASALEGALTMFVDGTADAVNEVTSGSGADQITVDGIAGGDNGFVLSTGAAADVVIVTTNGDGNTAEIAVDGGLGTDTLRLNNTVDISDSTVTLTSVEVIDLVGDATVSSALLSGASLIIDGNADSDLTVIVDGTTIDLSGLAFTSDMLDANDSIVLDGSGNAIGQVFTGSLIHDTISGGSASDVISGGDGDDIIDAGAGADRVTGGDGSDILVFNDNDSGVTVATADIVTDFTTAEDQLDLAGYLVPSAATDYSEADGSAAADFTALVALADAAFANDVGDGVHVLVNALDSGNAYVFFDASGDKQFGAGDTLLILQGVSALADIGSGDFI
jgi:hypothetical protein